MLLLLRSWSHLLSPDRMPPPNDRSLGVVATPAALRLLRTSAQEALTPPRRCVQVKPLPGGAEGGAEEVAADAANTVYSGRLKYSDVTAAESADVSTTYKKRPSELVAPRVTDALAELKAAIAEAVRGFEAQLRTKSI